VFLFKLKVSFFKFKNIIQKKKKKKIAKKKLKKIFEIFSKIAFFSRSFCSQLN